MNKLYALQEDIVRYEHHLLNAKHDEERRRLRLLIQYTQAQIQRIETRGAVFAMSSCTIQSSDMHANHSTLK